MNRCFIEIKLLYGSRGQIILQGHMGHSESGHSESGQSESVEIYFTNALPNGNKIKYIGLMYA